MNFLADKYAVYVLDAYGATALILGWLLWATLAANARARRELAEAERERGEALEHRRAGAQHPQLTEDGPDIVVDDLSGWGYFTRCLGSKYSQFSGRARRSEYWYFMFFWFLLVISIAIVKVLLEAMGIGTESVVFLVFFGVVIFVTAIPILAVTARRLHDIGVSGWYVIIQFIPYIGVVIIFVLMVMSSNKGRNRFGPAPYHQLE